MTSTILILALAAAAATALLMFIIMKRRFEKAPEIEPLLEYGFDERDKVILKTLGTGEATLSDLSKTTGLNKSVVWRRLERLRELGYVEKIYSRVNPYTGLRKEDTKHLRSWIASSAINNRPSAQTSTTKQPSPERRDIQL